MSLKSIACVENGNTDTWSEEMLTLVKGSVIHDNQTLICFSIGLTIVKTTS